MEIISKENGREGDQSMIGIFTAILGAFGFIGGNLNEQWQNDQARINSTRNPQNTTGTYMDFRGRMRDAKTNKPVILSGDGKGNIIVKDTYGITMRVCKVYHEPESEVNPEPVSYNLRNAKAYIRPLYCDSWQCEDCGAWNYILLDKKCRGCNKEKTENAKIHIVKKLTDAEVEQ